MEHEVGGLEEEGGGETGQPLGVLLEAVAKETEQIDDLAALGEAGVGLSLEMQEVAAKYEVGEGADGGVAEGGAGEDESETSLGDEEAGVEETVGVEESCEEGKEEAGVVEGFRRRAGARS